MEILTVKGQRYDTFGTHITTTMSAKGDITLKQYYSTYDTSTKTYLGLLFEIELTRNRDSTTGLPTSEVTTRKVFKGGQLYAQDTHTHYFNIETVEGAMAACDRNIESATTKATLDAILNVSFAS